jgi:hypothetical protein
LTSFVTFASDGKTKKDTLLNSIHSWPFLQNLSLLVFMNVIFKRTHNLPEKNGKQTEMH